MALTHGRPGTYVAGCRCDPCTEANRLRCKRMAARRIAKAAADPTAVPHGLGGYLNWSCRCEVCKEAARNRTAGNWDRSRNGLRWTDDELAEMARDDIPLPAIAERLRRSYQAVAAKRHEMRKGMAA